mmetsp:Transcript_29866/g.75169  ORF Transcript_29866/g.75169 Transcript_29866/m.75169 type:complete len:206 (+) Transcript_29866:347-964(+)
MEPTHKQCPCHLPLFMHRSRGCAPLDPSPMRRLRFTSSEGRQLASAQRFQVSQGNLRARCCAPGRAAGARRHSWQRGEPRWQRLQRHVFHSPLLQTAPTSWGHQQRRHPSPKHRRPRRPQSGQTKSSAPPCLIFQHKHWHPHPISPLGSARRRCSLLQAATKSMSAPQQQTPHQQMDPRQHRPAQSATWGRRQCARRSHFSQGIP